MAVPVIGVSLKTYFSHARARAWFDAVAARVRADEAVAGGAVELFVTPTFLQIPAAVAAFAGTRVRVGAQDLSADPAGAFTGEIAAAELAEVGAAIAEIGHAERRRRHGETDAVVAAKARRAREADLTPLLCIGEDRRAAPEAAARIAVDQLGAALDDVPAGEVLVAYEPVWAIGAARPAPVEHARAVAGALRAALRADPARSGSRVLYGGAAGPGLLSELGDAVDGLFLGRFAHDPGALASVLHEAAALAAGRP
ncbi:triose-phosphate isomerase family protein [Microbacterium gilvum]|uniref:Triosephosphate isomerase n=1 Tax=Microbacterium gilvum TaxID=1336204 RepID=A0ABP8ZYT8_9MICO